jgi:hypothetical protein
MRSTNPDGTLGIRSATLCALPRWSGFGKHSNTGSHSYRPTKQANAAKIGLLKSPDTRSFLSFLASILSSSIRLQTGFPNAAAVWGNCEQTGVLSDGDERHNSGLRKK